MYEEEKTTPTAESAATNQTKPTKPKRTDEEKLQECYERRDRLREQKNAHRARASRGIESTRSMTFLWLPIRETRNRTQIQTSPSRGNQRK